ncbi:carbonic anhydrase [Mycobacterium sp. ML4]
MFAPSTAWQLLKSGNHGYATGLRSQATNLNAHGAPAAVVFRCADDTIPSEQLFDQQPGSLVTVSTWGHVIDTGVLATMEYAVGTLHTPLIIVLGHHRCAAMHTALQSASTNALPTGATRLVIEQAMSTLLQSGAETPTADQLAAAHVAHVGAALLGKSPMIAHAVDTQQCAIVSLTVDLTTGRLHNCGTLGALDTRATPLQEAV